MIYKNLCSYDNLILAFKKARKKKTTKPYVIGFEQNLKNNLLNLQNELTFLYYEPKHLETFILRDPKTRKISKSEFRDRIVHHAICNVIEPIFEKQFIYDSYANRKNKGVLKAIQRFEEFKRKVSCNNSKHAYVLKCDIYHYFETVQHEILLKIINKKISNSKILWLIKKILSNHRTMKEGTGMPLGNLTSQFFANVYLNELDQFVKHKLKAEYYIRYVDDFVIFSQKRGLLKKYKQKINAYLNQELALILHPDKSRIIPINRGTEFLGFKIFSHHKMPKKKNRKKFIRKIKDLCKKYDERKISYDKIYDTIEGWISYAKNANTYKLRKKILKKIEPKFRNEISTKEINRHLKHKSS